MGYLLLYWQCFDPSLVGIALAADDLTKTVPKRVQKTANLSSHCWQSISDKDNKK